MYVHGWTVYCLEYMKLGRSNFHACPWIDGILPEIYEIGQDDLKRAGAVFNDK